LLMTAVLSVLIWASADSLVNETASLGVTFEVVPDAGASDMIVEPGPSTEPHEIQISGPRRDVEDIVAKAPLRVRLRIPERPTGTGRYPIDRAALKNTMAEQWTEFRKLTLVSVEPETLPVVVDHKVNRQVELTTSRLTLAYDVEPQFQRGAVSVRMRESRLAGLPSPDRPQVDLSSDIERLLKEQTAGQNVTIPVTIDTRVFGPDAQMTPATVNVTATVKERRTTATIPTVPILFAVSVTNLSKPLKVAARDGSPLPLLAPSIQVTGPTDEVAKLVRGATRAYGILHLREDDLADLGRLKLMTPDYHLPPGVELAEVPSPIEFKLLDATSADAPK